MCESAYLATNSWLIFADLAPQLYHSLQRALQKMWQPPPQRSSSDMAGLQNSRGPSRGMQSLDSSFCILFYLILCLRVYYMDFGTFNAHKSLFTAL